MDCCRDRKNGSIFNFNFLFVIACILITYSVPGGLYFVPFIGSTGIYLAVSSLLLYLLKFKLTYATLSMLPREAQNLN